MATPSGSPWPGPGRCVHLCSGWGQGDITPHPWFPPSQRFSRPIEAWHGAPWCMCRMRRLCGAGLKGPEEHGPLAVQAQALITCPALEEPRALSWAHADGVGPGPALPHH